MSALYLYDAAYAPLDGQGRPNVALWKQHGAVAGSHYLCGTYAQSSPQPADLHAAGLGALLNWERQPAALVGAPRSVGQAAAREAMAAVPAGCPVDGSVAIYFSVDVDVTNMGACDEAFRGIVDVLAGKFRAAVYGEIGLINHLLFARILTGRHWLSMSEGFSPPGGYGAVSPNVCLVQMHDAAGHWIGTDLPGTDRNTITDPYALGAWWPDNSPYKGADMPLTDADAAAIWGHKIGDDVGTAAQTLHDARQIAATARDNAAAAGATAANAVRAAAALAAQVATLTAAVKALQGGGVVAAAPGYEGTVTLTPRPGV